jgi:primosomal protein N''
MIKQIYKKLDNEVETLKQKILKQTQLEDENKKRNRKFNQHHSSTNSNFTTTLF